MRLAHTTLFAACAAALFATATARAEGAKVAVVPFAPLNGEVPEKAGAKAAMLLTGELKNLGNITPEELQVEKNEAASKALNDAHGLVDEAKGLRDRRRFGAAAATYRKALEQYDIAAAKLEGPEGAVELSDVHVALGIVYYLTGDDVNGANELRQAVSLTPSRTFPEEKTSQLFAATAKKIRDAVLNDQRSVLQIESMPLGAKVLLDGQEVGRTPITIKQVPPGQHLWRVLLSASDNVGGIVTLKPGARQSISATLSGTSALTKLNKLLLNNKVDEAVLTAAKDVAAAAQADLVAFGTIYFREEQLFASSFLYSPSQNVVVRLPQKSFDAEMLDAGTAMYEVASDVATRTETLGTAEKLGQKILSDALPASAIQKTDIAYTMPGETLEKADDAKQAGKRPINVREKGTITSKLRDRSEKGESPEPKKPLTPPANP